jgi:hypothetical protein
LGLPTVTDDDTGEKVMKSSCKLPFVGLLCLFLPLLWGNCASLVEKTGGFLDGSSRAEKNLSVYRTVRKNGADMGITEVRTKAGTRSVIITLEQFPMIKIRGSAPDGQGEFYLTSLDYLGGSPHGWNEYRLDIAASGNLVLGESTATLSIADEIITVEISSGRIRRFDTRITGNEALASLSNRRKRILALTEWMEAPHDLNRDDFEKYWKPVLFPELVSRKKRPEGWRQEGDNWVRAEDIRWNSSYTERVFPEELWAIRDSGTMLRDWEEAFEWIYVEYSWNRITELLSRETVLNKAKK